MKDSTRYTNNKPQEEGLPDISMDLGPNKFGSGVDQSKQSFYDQVPQFSESVSKDSINFQLQFEI